MTDDDDQNVVPLTPATVNQRKSTGQRPVFQRGNPGRRKGSKNKRPAVFNAIFQANAEDVARRILQACQGGDMAACRIAADRISSARRGAPVAFDLPAHLDLAGLSEASEQVIRDMAGSELTPEEGTIVLSAIETRRKLIETEELEARLAAVEQRIARDRR